MLPYLCSLYPMITHLSVSLQLSTGHPEAKLLLLRFWVKIYLSTHTLGRDLRTLIALLPPRPRTAICIIGQNKLTDLRIDEKLGAGGKEREGRRNKIHVHLIQTEGTGATRWCHHSCKAGFQPQGTFSLRISVSVTHSCQSTMVRPPDILHTHTFQIKHRQRKHTSPLQIANALWNLFRAAYKCTQIN